MINRSHIMELRKNILLTLGIPYSRGWRLHINQHSDYCNISLRGEYLEDDPWLGFALIIKGLRK